MIRLLKVAAVLVAVLMGAALIVPSLVLRTDGGRGWARGVAERQLNTILGGRGRIGIGSITALSTSSATLRDITLHDRWGGRIARIGETQLRFHPGALTRKVVHFRAIDVRDVELDVIQRLDSVFNVVSLLPDTSAPRRGPPGWGDDVRADSVRISNGRMQVQVLWAPHRTFVGQERDSITALYRTFHDVRDTAGRLVVTRRFTSMNGTLTDAHFTRPEGGGVVRLASLATVMSDPALPVRDAQGTLEWSPARQLRIDLPRVVLRETRGAVRGTVGWKDPGPVRYDLDVPADSVALADINWVWPALPVTGGGRTRLTIRSADDADIVDYALDSLAMVAEGSDVRGQVTVRVTPRTIELSRMHLAFAPLSARVIRRVMEGELPEPLRGDVRGSVHANAGGPLAAVRIDSARLTYREQGGATARLAFDGVVGSGASTILRNVRVREFVLPLGIARPLVAEWPAGLDGTLTARGVVSGDLTRGSVDASGLTIGLTGANGRAVSLTGRVSGTGLLTDAGRFDLSIASTALDPRALGALGDSLPIAGPIAVQLAARGTVQRFTVDAALRPPSDTAGIRVVGTVARTTARAAFDGSVALNGLDVRALTQRDALPRTRLSGSVTVAASATRDARRATPWQLVDGAVRGRIAQPDGEGLLEATLTADVSLDATALSVRHAELVSPSARASLLGVLRRDSVGAPPDWRPLIVTAEGDSVVGDSLHAAVRVDSLHAFVGDLRRLARALPEGDSLRAQIDALPDSIGGEVYATAHVTGSVATPRALLDVDARRMAIGPITVGDASVRADGRWPLDGTLRATAHDIAGAALGLTTVTLTADSVRTDGARLALRAEGRDAPTIRSDVRVRLAGDSTIADVLALQVDARDTRLALARPARIVRTPAATTLDSLRIDAANGGRLAISGAIPARGAIRGALTATRLPLVELSTFLAQPEPLRGTVDARVTLAGTRDAPLIEWYVRGDTVGRGDLSISGVEAEGSYADRELIGSVIVDARRSSTGEQRLPTTALRGSWSVPVDLTLRERTTSRLLDAPVAARLDIDSLALGDLPLALETVRDVRGVADGHVLVKGTARAPRLEGALTIANGRFSAEAAGLDIRNLALVVRGAGREVTLERLRWTSGASAADSLSLTGRVRLADGARDRGQVEARGVLRNLAVLRRGDLADLDLSGEVEARGSLDSVVVTAGLTVPRGTIYRDAVESRAAIDLASSEALELLGADAPAVAPTAALDLVGVARRIRRSSIRIRAGEDLWVRAPTVAAKVGGEVTLVVDRGSLVPTGELTAQRGLYRLDLGVVKRTFDVDSGRVRFFGAQAIAPTVDVYASHDVRQASGGEVTVRAHIAGTLERPTLTLSTDDAIGGRVPDTEVISLLLFGAPTFALDGTSRSTVQSVTNVLLPSVGGFVEGALGRLLPVFNTVQLTTAGGAEQSGSRFDLLNNVALSAGKQIGDRTFVRLNSGICRGTADAARDLTPWLGLAVEYRLSAALSVQASADPGTAPCSRVGTDALSRLQFGLDLFRNWIF